MHGKKCNNLISHICAMNSALPSAATRMIFIALLTTCAITYVKMKSTISELARLQLEVARLKVASLDYGQTTGEPFELTSRRLNPAEPQSLLAPPAAWLLGINGLQDLSHRLKRRDAAAAYLNMLSGLLTSAALECDLTANKTALASCLTPHRRGVYKVGRGLIPSWASMSVSMAGMARMRSLAELFLRLREARVEGSYLEAGVWRGGMSIFATAALQVYGMHERPVYLCDSFQGLPAPRRGSLRYDEKSYVTPQMNGSLAVGMSAVRSHFDLFGVPRTSVSLVPGYFVHSLPPLRASLLARHEKLAFLRMDGDMYDSTIDILYNLYDLVQVGGYVVIDDFGWDDNTRVRTLSGTPATTFGAKNALLDFRAVHGIEDEAHTMHDIDGTGAWFRKSREVPLQRDRYLKSLSIEFQPMNWRSRAANIQKLLQPHPPLSAKNYVVLRQQHEKWTGGEEERSRINSLRLDN